MNEWMWWIALPVLFAAGLGLGFLWGRSRTDEAQKAKSLEEELRQAREEMNRYKEQVAAHFATTAELMEKLTEDYRSVYQHLAESSEALCGADAPRLLKAPEATPLGTSQKPVEVKAETTAETAPAAKTKTEATEAPPAETAEPAAETEPTSAPVTEEKKAEATTPPPSSAIH